MVESKFKLLLFGKTGENSGKNPVAKVLGSGIFFWAVILITTSIAIGFGALSEDRRNFDDDEIIYMRVIQLFGDKPSVELLRTYDDEPASPAPLFFLLYAGWGKLFGFNYSAFRGLSLLLTLLTMLCVWLFLRRYWTDEHKDSFPLLLFLFPYIFCMGFSVMAEPLTLLFTVIGLCCYIYGLKQNSSFALFLGSLAITAALYARIHAVFACAALIAVLLLQKNRSPLKWFLAILPVIMRLPLIFLQQGLTVSRAAFAGTKPELGLCLSNINFFLVWFGYMFFPLLWWVRTRKWINSLAVLALIPFYFLVCPDFFSAAHSGALRTILLNFGIESNQAKWILFPAWFIGCYITIDLIQRILFDKDFVEVFLRACVVVFMLQLIFSTVAFERYYQLAVSAIVLLGVKRTNRTSGYIAFAACHFLFLALAFVRLLKDLV